MLKAWQVTRGRVINLLTTSRDKGGLIVAKEVKSLVKLQIPAGKANPAPPVGPALGQAGVNIQEFCTQFNERTKEQMGNVIPVVITVFTDRSF